MSVQNPDKKKELPCKNREFSDMPIYWAAQVNDR